MSVRRLIALLCLAASSCLGQELTIAAASDLQAVLPEVGAAFARQTGKKVRIAFGSSGNLVAQIQNGAPFDLFFSADSDYPRRLEAAGLTRKDSRYVYATGQIVVWAPNGSTLDLDRLGLRALTAPEVKRIAIANPAHAPYGRAAEMALQRAGIFDQVKDKLVLGENISQATQFVQTGNAQAGIIALSLALSPQMRSAGKYWVVPPALYPRLEQAAVVLRRARDPRAAEEFLAFLQSGAGREVMERFGFAPPAAEPGRGRP